MEIRYHPQAAAWLRQLAEQDEEVIGEVVALLTALEIHGRDLVDDRREESHRVATSPYDLHALRRTPPTEATPYAISPPVIRILYCFCIDGGDEIALVLIGGDKTTKGNRWYPPAIAEAHARIREYMTKYPSIKPLRKQGF